MLLFIVIYLLFTEPTWFLICTVVHMLQCVGGLARSSVACVLTLLKHCKEVDVLKLLYLYLVLNIL